MAIANPAYPALPPLYSVSFVESCHNHNHLSQCPLLGFIWLIFKAIIIIFEKLKQGIDGSWQTWIWKIIVYAIRLLKIYVLFMLEIFRVISLSSTLCTIICLRSWTQVPVVLFTNEAIIQFCFKMGLRYWYQVVMRKDNFTTYMFFLIGFLLYFFSRFVRSNKILVNLQLKDF